MYQSTNGVGTLSTAATCAALTPAGVDAPSAPSGCGKRGQQVRRWLERRGRRAVRPPRKRRGAPPRGRTVAKVAAPQPEPRRTCLDEPGHWARGCLGVVSELALRRGTARARHREGRCRRPWRAVLATLPSTAVAAACFRARLAGEPSPGERAAREFRPPAGRENGHDGSRSTLKERAGWLPTTWPGATAELRHRPRRRRPGPGRPPTLALSPPGGHDSRRVVNRCAHAVRPAEVAASRVSVMICHRDVVCRRRRGLTSAVETARHEQARGRRTRPTLDRAAGAISRSVGHISLVVRSRLLDVRWNRGFFS